jgi:hypothetical protein
MKKPAGMNFRSAFSFDIEATPLRIALELPEISKQHELVKVDDF